MGYYSLPNKKHNEDMPNEYKYITIVKYPEDYFKPTKGKRLSAEESKNKKEKLDLQATSLKQLDTGYYNMFNNFIEVENSMSNSSFFGYLDDMNTNTIFRINPLASNKKDSGRYECPPSRYKVYEFDVVKKLTTKEDVIDQILKDGILGKFMTLIFDRFSYANEGYDLKLYEYFSYIKNKYPEFKFSLSDLILSQNYNHNARGKFWSNNTQEVNKKNITYLLDNNLMLYKKDNDWYMEALVIALIECGFFEIALHCTNLMKDSEIKALVKKKEFDIELKKWNADEYIKQIIKNLNITLSGVVLKVLDGYGTIVETKNFNNINEVKTHLIKEYNVEFEEIANKDISNLEIWNDDNNEYYKCEIN